jgi:flagellar biosynthesis/type III secretory pathway M-ring protein FliF/YscJ
MLLAGAVAVIVTYINHYSLEDMLVVLILTLIVFLILGVVIKLIFDSFHIEEPDEDRVDDEGEVVEKTEFSEENENIEDEGNAVSDAEEQTGEREEA